MKNLMGTAPADSYQRFDVTPLPGALGAEIRGLDLGEALASDKLRELNAAFLQYQVLVFREQSLELHQHLDFAARFGPLFEHPYVEPIAEHRAVIRVLKECDDTVNNGGAWHIDLTFMKRPPKASVLRMIDVPLCGGDTLFANMYEAYDALSSNMKRYLDGAEALHTASQLFGPTGYYRHQGHNSSIKQIPSESEYIVMHPVVRTHPETHRRSLFLNPGCIERLMDVPPREGQWILEYLYQHCSKGEYCTRIQWQKDTVVMWDNRCTMHYALNDYHGQRREGLRVMIAGDKPR